MYEPWISIITKDTLVQRMQGDSDCDKNDDWCSVDAFKTNVEKLCPAVDRRYGSLVLVLGGLPGFM